MRYGMTGGHFVQAVTLGGPADDAGIHPGDVVTAIDGQSATNLDVLTHVQLTNNAGDTIKIDYLRGGAGHSARVTLAD